jgi:hypothetical protein
MLAVDIETTLSAYKSLGVRLPLSVDLAKVKGVYEAVYW